MFGNAAVPVRAIADPVRGFVMLSVATAFAGAVLMLIGTMYAVVAAIAPDVDYADRRAVAALGGVFLAVGLTIFVYGATKGGFI